MEDKPSNADRKELKSSIIKAIEKSEMVLKNPNDIRSRRDFNQYKVEYTTNVPRNEALKENLIVESYLSLKSFPYERRYVKNYIYNFLYTGMNFIILSPCLPMSLRHEKGSTSPNLV